MCSIGWREEKSGYLIYRGILFSWRTEKGNAGNSCSSPAIRAEWQRETGSLASIASARLRFRRGQPRRNPARACRPLICRDPLFLPSSLRAYAHKPVGHLPDAAGLHSQSRAGHLAPGNVSVASCGRRKPENGSIRGVHGVVTVCYTVALRRRLHHRLWLPTELCRSFSFSLSQIVRFGSYEKRLVLYVRASPQQIEIPGRRLRPSRDTDGLLLLSLLLLLMMTTTQSAMPGVPRKTRYPYAYVRQHALSWS